MDGRILRFVKQDLSKEGAHLLPLRLFVGMGWLRAFAEKVSDPGWHDGAVLAAFLEEGLAGDHVVFPLEQPAWGSTAQDTKRPPRSPVSRDDHTFHAVTEGRGANVLPSASTAFYDQDSRS